MTEDAVGAYLRLIGAYPLLDAQQERALSARIARGRDAAGGPRSDDVVADADAALHALVESNLRLVVHLAKRYPVNSRVDLADLIQAGNQGLCRAAELFDGRKGFKFSTYASRWINQSIGRMLDKSSSALHMPIDTCCTLRAALRTAGGSPSALPEHLRGLELAYYATTLDAPVHAQERGATLGELQADRSDSVETIVLRREEHRLVHDLLAGLPDAHREAVVLRYGIDGPGRSYAEIAEVLGISLRAVSRLLVEATTRLREAAPALR